MPIPSLFRSVVKETFSLPQAALKRLDTELRLEKQATEVWCWASVGLAVALFYDQSSRETQCSIAAKVKEVSSCCDNDGTVLACIEPDKTEEALLKHLSVRNPPSMAFQDALEGEYSSDRPLVCVMNGWQVGGVKIAAHALIVRGSLDASGMKYVKYVDPSGPFVDRQDLRVFEARINRFILTDKALA